MNTASRLSAADRDRALARLRSLTIGTTLASVAAVGAFGFVGALTNPGTADAVGSTSGTNTSGSSSSGTSGSNGTTSGGDSSGSSLSGSNQDSSGTPLQPAPTPATTTRHHGHVTTGGS